MEVYKIKDLSFTYAGSAKKTLSEISVTVNQGEFIVLCGKSGCGKTTLLRQLKSVLTPYGESAGEIMFEGQPLNSISLREQAQEIGYVLQHPDHQIVTDKVWHELAFGLENLGCAQQIIQLRVAEMVAYLGISDWYYKDVSKLSGGQKQLMNLAAVLVMHPKVLILDEPTSQLDPLATEEFVRIIKKIQEEFGTTILFSAHCLDDVMAYADRVIVMEEGRILADDTPRKIAHSIRKNDMAEALPVPVQMAMRLDQTLHCGGMEQDQVANEILQEQWPVSDVADNNRMDYPVTLREGRDYLNQIYHDVDFQQENGVKEPNIVDNKSLLTTFCGVKGNKKEALIVSAKDLWYRYEKNGKDVLIDLSLHIKKGEIYALLGANGSGKTTAMSVLGGLKKPYRGYVKIEDKKITSYSNGQLFDHLLAILPQDVQTLFVADTVEEDLQLMIKDVKKRGMQKEEAQELLAKTIEQMEIADLLAMHPYDLSGGEAQRVALAKVLLLSPKLLFLDEPTKGMDACYKKRFGELLGRLKEQGVTIFLISHDVEFSARYADTCGLLFQGNIVAERPAHEFFLGNSFYTTAANRMGRHLFPNVITVEELVKTCLRKGAPCDGK
jgi:energy-coupling factor transport system ATP-binding protein